MTVKGSSSTKNPSSAATSATLNGGHVSWSEYASMLQENQMLRKENARLQQMIENQKLISTPFSESEHHNLGMLQGLLAMCD